MLEIEKLIRDLQAYHTTNRNYHSGDVLEHTIWTMMFIKDAIRNPNNPIHLILDYVSRISPPNLNVQRICIIASFLHDIGKGGDGNTTFFDKPGHEQVGANMIANNTYYLLDGNTHLLSKQKVDFNTLFTELNCNPIERLIITVLVAGHYLIGSIKVNKDNMEDAYEHESYLFIKYIGKLCSQFGLSDYLEIHTDYFKYIVWMQFIVCIADALASRPYIGNESEVSFPDRPNYKFINPTSSQISRFSTYDSHQYNQWLFPLLNQVKDLLDHMSQEYIIKLVENNSHHHIQRDWVPYMDFSTSMCNYEVDKTKKFIHINSWRDYHDQYRLDQYICKHPATLSPSIQEWSNQHPNLIRSSLSATTKQWLNDYLDGLYMFDPKNGLNIDPAIISELQQYRLRQNITCYRGLHYGITEIDKLKEYCMAPFNSIYYFNFSSPKPTSWTWNYYLAENFAKLGNFNFVVAYIFEPKDILVDLRLIPEYCSMRGNNSDLGLQDEIIVLPGTYKCSFINNTIPFDKSYLLQKEDDINALSRLSDFFIHNKNNFVINKIDIINPPVFIRGPYGVLGGLDGIVTFTKRHDYLKICFDIDLLPNKTEYILQYGFASNNLSLLQRYYNSISAIKGIVLRQASIQNVEYTDPRCLYCDEVYIPRKNLVEYPNVYIQPKLNYIITLLIILLNKGISL